MRKYKNAGELIRDYNTPKTKGGLMGKTTRHLQRGECVKSTWTWHTIPELADKLPSIVIVDEGETVCPPDYPKEQNGGFPASYIDGKFWGSTGMWCVQRTHLYSVVEKTPSGAFVFENIIAERLSLSEAKALL